MKKFISLALFCCAFTTVSVHANLLISPTNVVIEDRQRSSNITVINNGKTTRTYRLSWQHKRAKPSGGYVNVTDTPPLQLAADQFIKISPRQVTLAAGERQTIRLSARRPKGLLDGEYRSHLLFSALPENKSAAENGAGGSISIDVLMNYSMPVIVRQGQDKVAVNIAGIEHRRAADSSSIAVHFERTGKHSVVGNAIIYWQASATAPTQEVARINAYRLYPELDHAQLNIPAHSDIPNSGLLSAKYLGLGKDKGKLLSASEAIAIH
ncbi:molecular chaperone [Ferrimonas lipolytica]|uniref:Molecular chaperone n=1 Tax=Ferrimonas lipolytica TaxID=2724191 RepID=A0A6H1UI66_9GAMM|nr:fimbria/pilus periplasmic chaperone [Ferrimonas lipolytica]QIZ77482.1 molecular chaperone [Ferrimonas lipolytica]